MRSVPFPDSNDSLICLYIFLNKNIFLYSTWCTQATSFLDVQSEKLAMNALRGSGSTLVVVAHRLSTIMDAKEIIVLKEGEIDDRGTHDELISMNGSYTEMWEKQQASITQSQS
jgi:ABC-type transport system involved in Fe-S cluster assembly fused permease/ATPase subunit